MVQPRKRYQSQLVREQIPTIDFAGEREMARGYKSIAAALDRMGSQFQQAMTQEAQIEGAEYGILNAPTAEQIIDAKKTGKDLSIPGDTSSVYGRAVKKAALTQANDEITLLAKKDILALLTDAEINETPSADVKASIEEVVAGYASVFDAESPVLAKQFRAEMGIYGYAKANTYASDFLTKNNEKKQAGFFARFLIYKDGIGDIIRSQEDIPAFVEHENGAVVNPDNQTGSIIPAEKMINDIINLEKSTLLAEAVGLNMSTSEIEKIANLIDAEADQARIDIVTSEVLNRTTGHKTFLGNLEQAAAGSRTHIDNLPPSVKNALLSAKPEKRLELVDKARSAWHTKIDDVQKGINYENSVREYEVNQAHLKFSKVFTKLASTPGFALTEEMNNEANEALEVIKIKDPTKYIELRDRWNDVSSGNADNTDSPGLFAPTSDSGVVFGFEQDLVRREPQLNIADLNTALITKKLTKEDYLRFAKQYEGLLDPRMTEAFELIRTAVGVPKNIFADKEFLNSQAAKVMNSAKANILRLSGEDTLGTFDPVIWVRENIGDYIVQQTGDFYSGLRQWANAHKYSNVMQNISEMRGNNNTADDALADELDLKLQQLRKAIDDGFIRVDDIPSFAVDEFLQ